MKKRPTVSGPFSLKKPEQPARKGVRPVMESLLGPALEKTLAFDTLNQIYQDIQDRNEPDRQFCDKVLDALNVKCQIAQAELDQVPRTGPLVVVANHPFGGLEGLMLEAILRRVRPDVKLLANYMLGMIPDLRPSLFLVDPFGRADSARKNMASMKAAMRWVQDGHALGVFPSGEVSHFSLKVGHVVEGPWNAQAARIAQKAGATVVCVYFEGRNSNLFHILGLVNRNLRTVMLPREMLRKRHGSVLVRVGAPVAAERVAAFGDADQLTDFLRVRTYVLKSTIKAARPGRPARKPKPSAPPAPIVAARSADELHSEVHALARDCTLTEQGEYSVLYCRAKEMPRTLHEIGRLREITFRAVSEGTGKAIDLDRFDDHYRHLFVYDNEQRRLVGAYRVGATDEILPKFGKDGLYTSTLFGFKDELLRELDPALEMGRSFVREEYQRNHSPLMLLWRGIGLIAVRDPRYKTLFGPVSISSEYNSTSKRLMVEFLRRNCELSELVDKIKPRTPPRLAPLPDWSADATGLALRSIADVEELIAQSETDTKSMPVLLRQYLRLNARVLAFNVDGDFGDVLDALMVIDLTRTSPAILVRYMGKENAVKFLSHHGIKI